MVVSGIRASYCHALSSIHVKTWGARFVRLKGGNMDLVNLDWEEGVLAFADGPTVSLPEWNRLALLGWSVHNQPDAQNRVLVQMTDDQKSKGRQVVDWIKKNHRRFEDWAAKNPKTYDAIKWLFIYLAWLFGIELELP